MSKKVSKPTILIVEDENLLAKALSIKLESDGFSVDIATNGQIGLEQALALHPDLILLDLLMPTMDGEAMLGELRKDGWGQQAKVIVLTNLNNEKQLIDAVGPVAGFLVKADWKLEDLVKKIKAVIKAPQR